MSELEELKSLLDGMDQKSISINRLSLFQDICKPWTIIAIAFGLCVFVFVASYSLTMIIKASSKETDMPFTINWRCQECGKELNRCYMPDSKMCPACAKDAIQKERKRHFKELDSMSIEERLRKLEEFQYDHSHDKLQPKEQRYR